jgi:magnesium chelatase family protein
VHDVEHAKLLSNVSGASHSQAIKQRVEAAYKLQAQRFGSAKFNSSMNNKQIRQLAKLSPGAKQLLDSAAEKLDISARSYVRSVKVARTIADLDNSSAILPIHISEALQYRFQAAAAPILVYGD